MGSSFHTIPLAAIAGVLDAVAGDALPTVIATIQGESGGTGGFQTRSYPVTPALQVPAGRQFIRAIRGWSRQPGPQGTPALGLSLTQAQVYGMVNLLTNVSDTRRAPCLSQTGCRVGEG